MTKEETEKLVMELLSKTYAGYLATIDEQGQPSIRAVFNLRNEEKFPRPAEAIKKYDNDPYSVYISTNTSSIKMKQITENKRIAIYYSLPDEIKGIMIQGEAEIIKDMNFKKDIWVENWTMYYPQGYTDPDFTLLKIKPKLIRGWSRGPHEIMLD
ncbi:MAG: hypothetical protein FK734_05405 [Asgard group archaeon]|nr:hypothetical protein [Asgard group archaeon]